MLAVLSTRVRPRAAADGTTLRIAANPDAGLSTYADADGVRRASRHCHIHAYTHASTHTDA